MDILLLALLSGFVFYRLWSVLGTRTGNEKTRDWNVQTKNKDSVNLETDNVIVLPQRKMRIADRDDKEESSPLYMESLITLKQHDPFFSEDSFLRGACRAFEHIVNAYADANQSKLKKLLSADVYNKFIHTIEIRQKREETLNVDIQSVDAHISDIKLTEISAVITVLFESEQMLVTINADGQSFDNPARLTTKVNDVWTFERPLSDMSNMWLLIKTESKQS